MALTPPLFLDPQEAVSDPFLPSLCTTIAQVDLKELNPHEDIALQLKNNVGWLDDNGFSGIASQLLNCGHHFIHLKDANGHEKYGKMYCKHEICPTCGRKGSRVHKTRVTRARDRLMWAPVLGYVVFTFPADIAKMRLERDVLNLLEKEAYSIIQHHFQAPGGMIRVHLAGDRLGSLRIHINALFPVLNTNGIGKVDSSIIDAARKAWTLFINDYFKLSIESADLHYSFSTKRAQKAAKIKYVLRPIIDAFMFMTLSDEDKRYIVSLSRWHNTRWFGKLSNALYKKYLLEKGVDPVKHEHGDPYLSNVCPVCGARFKFVDIVSRSDLPGHRLRWLDEHVAVDFEIYAALKKKDTQ